MRKIINCLILLLFITSTALPMKKLFLHLIQNKNHRKLKESIEEEREMRAETNRRINKLLLNSKLMKALEPEPEYEEYEEEEEEYEEPNLTQNSE